LVGLAVQVSVVAVVVEVEDVVRGLVYSDVLDDGLGSRQGGGGVAGRWLALMGLRARLRAYCVVKADEAVVAGVES
jgi:hypothetical protein